MPEENTTTVQTPEPVADPKHKTPMDSSAHLFSEGRKDGVEVGKKDATNEFNTQLSALFGTNDPKALAEISDFYKKKKESSQSDQDKFIELKNQNAELAKKITQNELDGVERTAKTEIMSDVLKATPANQDMANLISNYIYDNYETKDGMIYKRGSSVPEFTEGVKSTMENIVAELKKGPYSSAFEKAKGLEHINDGTATSGPTAYRVKKDDLYRPGFRSDLSNSSEQEKYMNGDLIDLTKLKKSYTDYGITFG